MHCLLECRKKIFGGLRNRWKKNFVIIIGIWGCEDKIVFRKRAVG